MSVTPAVLENLQPIARQWAPGRPLRVLQVIASVADVNGGASTAIWCTLEALRKRGIHADLITTDEDGPKRRMQVPLGKFVRRGEHRVCFFPAWLDRYTTSWPMARWLLEHVRDYDVVHVHGLFRFAPAAAAYAALIRGVPYVLTLHNTLGYWGMRYRRPLLKRLSIGLIEGRIVDRARRVHLCSSEELTQVARVRQLGARSAVFPLGVDFAPDRSAESETDGQASLPESLAGRKIVLFMSRIHEIKGLDRLLMAFANVQTEHPDALLVIAGTGDQKLTAALQQLASQLGIEQRTHWLGFVQGSLKRELLAAACLFVLPSHSENFGYAVVEALLAGVPVITTTQVPSGEFVTAAAAGIVCDGTAASLAQSIREMLTMTAENRAQLGSRASTTVRDRLSLENYGESLEGLYREASARSSYP